MVSNLRNKFPQKSMLIHERNTFAESTFSISFKLLF